MLKLSKRPPRGFALGLVLGIIVTLAVLTAVIVSNSLRSVRARDATSLRQEAGTKLNSTARAIGGQISILAEELLRTGSSSQTFSERVTAVLNNLTQSGRKSYAANVTVSALLQGGVAADLLADLRANLALPFSLITLPSSRVVVRSGPVWAKANAYQFTMDLADTAKEANQVELATTQQRRVTIVEMPSQFAVETGQLTLDRAVNGSVVAESITLQTDTTGRVLARSALTWTGTPTVDGYQLPNPAQASLDVLRQTDSNYNAQVNYLPTHGELTIIPLGDRTLDAEGVPAVFRAPTGSTTWDVYTHPYYSSNVRMTGSVASMATPVGPSPFAAVVADGAGSEAARTTETGVVSSSFARVFQITHPYLGGACVLLSVDCAALPIVNGARSLFVDLPTDGAPTRQRLIVGLRNAANLNSPLSIVSANPVAFQSHIGTGAQPVSILAPRVLRTIYPFNIPLEATLTKSSPSPDAAHNPYLFAQGSGVMTLPDTLTLRDVPATAGALPPVTLKSWWIFVDAPDEN